MLSPETGYDHGVELSLLADRDDRERAERIRRSWDAYYGTSPDPLKVRKGEANDNVRINYARLVVDAGVAHLFGSDLQVNLPPEADAAQDALNETIRINGGGLLWQKAGTSGAIGGTFYYRLMPQPVGPPRITCVDPSSVDVEWEPSDYETVTAYVVTWLEADGDTTATRRQRIERDGEAWIIVDQKGHDGGWTTIGEEAWPYPYAPMGHAQNLPSPHEVYGLSDLEPDVLRLCRSIDRTASNINRILRLYAHPRTWGRMIGDALNMDANPGAIIRLEHPQAELHNLEMQSDLSSSIDYYRRLVAALHETTRIPEVATGKLDSAGQLSSLALRILYSPLIAKTESKRRTYGQAIQEMMRRALDLQGFPDALPQIVWPELVPTDPEMDRRTSLMDQQLGVSRDTILEQLGYDPALEAMQRQDEQAEANAAMNAGLTEQPPDFIG